MSHDTSVSFVHLLSRVSRNVSVTNYEAVIFGKCIVFIWRCIFGMIDVSDDDDVAYDAVLVVVALLFATSWLPLGAHFPGCQTAFSMAANHSLICISQQIGCQLAIEKKRRWNESKTMIHINHKSHGETIRHRSDASDCRHTVRIPFEYRSLDSILIYYTKGLYKGR